MDGAAAPSWFGMGGGAALGVANNSQFRANNPGMASFAQTLGGGQQQASLDPSYVHSPYYSVHIISSQTIHPFAPFRQLSE